MKTSLDSTLVQEVRAIVDKHEGLVMLGSLEAESVVTKVADKFVDDLDQVWWWTSLKEEAITLPCEEDIDFALLKEVLKDATAEVLLVVTDDEPRPWLVFGGQFEAIVSVLSELRFFEFFITNRDCDWLIFETHHNALVVAGDLVEIAKSVKACLDED